MRSISLAALVFVIAFGAGCTQRGSAAGRRAPDYGDAAVTTAYADDLIGTYEACVKAMTDLGMTIRRSDKDKAGGFIEATRPDDMELVIVTFNAAGPHATKATIKVGKNGDEPYSRVVARRIEARLKG